MMLESLESRRLLSGAIVTETYPGFYEIYGDANDNDINVSVSMNEESFTLDGVTYYGAWYVFVDGGGGDDTISVVTIDGPGSIGAGIYGGDGNDRITLNFDGGVWCGEGDDMLYLTDSFRGEAYGEGGNDHIYIMGACLDAQIQGGAGNDFIDCSLNQYGVVVFGGNGNDTIHGSEFNDAIYGGSGDDMLFGRGGNDSFYAGPGPNDFIDGGSGYDIVYLAAGSDLTAVSVEEMA